MCQTYSMQEISENNGKNRKPVWIVVKSVVYDVTKLLQDHPGGDEIILEYAGKDATTAFNDAGHSVDAIQDMKLYKIGIVDNNKSPKHPTISTTQTSMDQQYSTKEKKRIKLFFCF